MLPLCKYLRRSTRTLFVLLFAAAITATISTGARAATATVTRTDISFTGGDSLRMHGTIVAPEPGTTPSAGIVLVGGSDWKTRSDLLPEAEAFARNGLVSLIYDKRTVGYSQTHRDYGLLAEDTLGAVAALRGRAGVDPARIGVWGVSEGGWVAPLAASRSPQVAFVITVGASGMGGAQQTAWYWGNLLRHDGVSGSMVRAFSLTGTRFAIGAGLFPEAYYDPVPVLERLRQPVLALWGEYDINHPGAESARIFEKAFARGGNTHYTIRFIPGGGPDLYRTTNRGFDRTKDLAAGYPELVASWVNGLTAGPPSAGTQAAPHPARPTIPPAPLAWYESTTAQAVAAAVFLIGFAGYPIASAAGRVRRRRAGTAAGRPAMMLASTGLLAVLWFFGYFGYLEATAARAVGPVVAGRPLPWLVVQLLAVGVVLSGLATGVSWWRHRQGVPVAHRIRLGLLLTAGLLFVPWALYWGLLLP